MHVVWFRCLVRPPRRAELSRGPNEPGLVGKSARFLDKDPRFEKCVVPVRKIHSSLLLTSVPQERREKAAAACHEAGAEIRTFLGDLARTNP
mmetsp:Transcript_93009/g.299372  ORF Transcript_93009/g.299372 Transcript_93009/m.299372 type:complete len:92 (-) Transcript_93009:601-876(-)